MKLQIELDPAIDRGAAKYLELALDDLAVTKYLHAMDRHVEANEMNAARKRRPMKAKAGK